MNASRALEVGPDCGLAAANACAAAAQGESLVEIGLEPYRLMYSLAAARRATDSPEEYESINLSAAEAQPASKPFPVSRALATKAFRAAFPAAEGMALAPA